MFFTSRNHFKAEGCLLLSLFILLLAQPDFSPLACILASSVGYALFFKAIEKGGSKKCKFWLSLSWFFLIQICHIGWLARDQYVGWNIYPVYLGLSLSWALQFAILVFLMPSGRALTLRSILALCSLWTFFEWSRLFLFSGYTFNPMGLSLTSTLLGMQPLSLVGIYGLSFWVLFTNLVVYKYFFCAKKSIYRVIIVILLPYIYGSVQLLYHLPKMEKNPIERSILLVQSALLPEQKVVMNQEKSPLTLLQQWERLLLQLKPYNEEKIDLIVFSEAVVPYGATFPLYSPAIIAESLQKILGKESDGFKDPTKVGNYFFAKCLADSFGADVVIGLEDMEVEKNSGKNHVYNAAFLLSPSIEQIRRYEKRILVPMGEYIPFDWCKKFLAKYGIQDSYKMGTQAKVFSTSNANLAMSICYEETFGHLMRQSRLKKADLLVNLTNDVWYPRSRLPIVHYLHGRLRAVETGAPLVRACNTGVTCGIDCLGRTVKMLEYECAKKAAKAGVCHLHLSGYTFFTPYTYYGDWLILLISLFFILLWTLSYFLKALCSCEKRRLKLEFLLFTGQKKDG